MRAIALVAIVLAVALTQSAQAIVLNEDTDWDRTWMIAKWVSAAETEVSGLKLRLEFWEDDSAFNFRLAVTNTGDATCILERPTQELFDFKVLRDGEVVWHYNRNRFFTQTPHTLTIDPGETQDYTATWDGKDSRGIPLKTWLGIDLEAQLKTYDEPLRRKLVNVYPTAANWRLSAFADVRRSHWAYDAFSSLQQMGVLRGYPDRWFSGDRTLTNYDMAQAVARLLDLMGSTEYDESVKALASALEAEFANQLAESYRVMVSEMGIVGVAELLGSADAD